MDSVIYWFESSNQLVAIVTDESGAGVTGATVTISVIDKEGEEVTGDTWPATMAALTAAGEYGYTPPYSLPLDNNTDYYGDVIALKAGLKHRMNGKIHVQLDVR